MQEEKVEFTSLSDAAQYAHVCRQAIFVAIKKGQLVAQKKVTRGKLAWAILRSDLDAYRASKYNREKRVVDGEKLFDLENNRWSVLHVSKTFSAMLGRSYPTAHIYYLLRTGKIRGVKKGSSWVLSREEVEYLYKKESGEDVNQMEFAQ